MIAMQSTLPGLADLERTIKHRMPRLVGGKGVLDTFPLPLNEAESSRLRESAHVIRQALDELGGNL